MIYAYGVGEVPISISGDAEEPDVLVHTVRAVGAVSRAICAAGKGDVLALRGPFGTEWPIGEAEGRDVVIVAGGIGLAPLRPAIYQVVHHRDRFRRAVLFYGARTPEDLIFRKDLENWRKRFDLHVYVTVDRGDAAWRGYVGVVTTLIHRAPFEPPNSTAFVCGPEVMIRFTALELQRMGVTPDRMHVSLERNMKCGCGFCGHCQAGPVFVCRDGPVFSYDRVHDLMAIREL
jgi:NAD(P)H-flavin reductase